MGSAAHRLEGAKHINRENAFEPHLVQAILVTMKKLLPLKQPSNNQVQLWINNLNIQ